MHRGITARQQFVTVRAVLLHKQTHRQTQTLSISSFVALQEPITAEIAFPRVAKHGHNVAQLPFIRLSASVCVSKRVHAHARKHAHTNANTHTHANTHIHTRKHTQTDTHHQRPMAKRIAERNVGITRRFVHVLAVEMLHKHPMRAFFSAAHACQKPTQRQVS